MFSSSELPRRFGDYVLLRLIGRGGNGSAFVAAPAAELGLPPLVIIKVLSEAGAERPASRARFEHEAKLAVAARVPAVAEVFDAGLVGDAPYIAMELVRGMTIYRLTTRLGERALRMEDVLKIASSGLAGVRALQASTDELGRALNAIHRDLSPKNLMTDARGEVRLLDLGLGRSILSEHHTRTGLVVGTPGYMSPEQVLGAKPTQATDVYSFGVIVWELITGRRYIERGSLPEVCRRTVTKSYESILQHRPVAPVALDELLRRALAIEPAARPQDAAELAAELARITLDAGADDGLALAALYAPELSDDELADLAGQELEVTTPDRMETTVYARRPPSATASEGAPTRSITGSGSGSSTRPVPVVIERTRAIGPGAVALAAVALAAATAFGIGVGRAMERRSQAQPARGAVEAPAVGARSLDTEAHVPPPASVGATAPRVTAVPEVQAIASPGALLDAGLRPSASPRSPARVEVPDARAAPPSDARASSPTTVATEDASALLDRLLARGAALKRERPERAAEIDRILNAAAFDGVAGDTAVARERLVAHAKALEVLAGP